MPKIEDDQARLTIRLPANTFTEVKALATELGLTPNGFIRTAIEAMIENHTAKANETPTQNLQVAELTNKVSRIEEAMSTMAQIPDPLASASRTVEALNRIINGPAFRAQEQIEALNEVIINSPAVRAQEQIEALNEAVINSPAVRAQEQAKALDQAINGPARQIQEHLNIIDRIANGPAIQAQKHFDMLNRIANNPATRMQEQLNTLTNPPAGRKRSKED